MSMAGGGRGGAGRGRGAACGAPGPPGKQMLSLLSAMPMVTSSRSTCSGSVPPGVTPTAEFASWMAAESGVCGSIASSHLIRSTLEASEEEGSAIQLLG